MADEIEVFYEGAHPQETRFRYRNWRGEVAVRRVRILHGNGNLFWGTSPHHEGELWLLLAWDLDRKDYRSFALKDVLNWVDE